MSKPKRKLTAAEKARKKLMRETFEWVFINGKQKRIRREPLIDGIPAEEFMRRNADPIWLLKNEMYEELHEWQEQEDRLCHGPPESPTSPGDGTADDDLPF